MSSIPSNTIKVRFLNGDEFQLNGITKRPNIEDVKLAVARRCERFMPEMTILCSSTGSELLQDVTEYVPPTVHVVCRNLAYTEETWLEIVRAHARASDVEGVKRAMACIENSSSAGGITEGVRPTPMSAQDCISEAMLDEVQAWPDNEVCLKVLLQLGAKVDFEDENGDTSLAWAALHGCSTMVDLLLRAGAEVDHENRVGVTSLFWASAKGHVDVVTQLLRAHADVDHANHRVVTALFWAARNGRDEVVHTLLDAGADVNHVHAEGATALAYACRYGYHDVVRRMLEAGATVDWVDPADGTTSLLTAIKSGNSDIVNLLVCARADLYHKDARGRTALDHAKDRDDEEIQELLLEAMQ